LLSGLVPSELEMLQAQNTLSAPERGDEQDEDGKQFEPPQQHPRRQRPFGGIGQRREVAGRSDDVAKRRADVQIAVAAAEIAVTKSSPSMPSTKARVAKVAAKRKKNPITDWDTSASMGSRL